MKQLNFTSICDILALSSLNKLVVAVLFIKHLLLQSSQLFLITLYLLRLFLQPLLRIYCLLLFSIIVIKELGNIYLFSSGGGY